MELQPARPRILVVDDEPDIQAGLKAFLETRLKSDVELADSGVDALARHAGKPFDIVLSDYKMPGLNGLDFLAKAESVWPRAVRVMMTAYADLDLAIQAINQARILHFFTKPIEPDHLIEVFGAILRAQVALRQRDDALRRSLEQMKRRQGRPSTT